jgi:hypothetical protein
MSSFRFPVSRAALLAFALAGQAFTPGQASGLGSIVQTYCLAAFQEEMSQAGKVPPEGMAAYACRCVVDRLTEGTSLSSARSFCRASTARRYSL